MPPQAKTIQIFLPDGNPRGIRVAEITSRTVEVILVPRAHLDMAAARTELGQVGVYFLLGEATQGAELQVYVGEAEDCLGRLRQHNKQKEFWNVALIAVSKTQYFTKSHAKYLEWFAHKAISTAGRYALENVNGPTKPYISESMEADLADNFDTMRVLVGALGYPLFDELGKPSPKATVHCKTKDADAKGEYTEDGLVVLAGSTAKLQEAPSTGAWIRGLRDGLKESGTLVLDGSALRFVKNHVFSSPSAAAGVVLGRQANGWSEWKYADDRTLDVVHRQNATPDD